MTQKRVIKPWKSVSQISTFQSLISVIKHVTSLHSANGFGKSEHTSSKFCSFINNILRGHEFSVLFATLNLNLSGWWENSCIPISLHESFWEFLYLRLGGWCWVRFILVHMILFFFFQSLKFRIITKMPLSFDQYRSAWMDSCHSP